ncbi:MAG: hypothetical protein ACI8PZ_004603 [Myxococcota bacterium]|jgi:hypothetical protein
MNLLIALLLASSAHAAPTLVAGGACPGPIDFAASGLTPDARYTVLMSTLGGGSDVIPLGPCAGVASGLAGMRYGFSDTADGDGGFAFNPTVPGGACGTWFQLLDVSTCTLSAAVTFDVCPLDDPDDTDGDGVCDSDDPCPTGGEYDLDGDGFCDCDDGDVCTLDITHPDLTCDNELQDTDGDGVCDALDTCPGGSPCDDGDPCTADDVCDGEVCAGDAVGDADGDGVCDTLDTCHHGDPCDDGAACTGDDTCDGETCEGVWIGAFEHADGSCDCDDEDPCTDDVVYDGIVCINEFEDADRDGVCDAFDTCPGGSPCDDGDACTTGDTCEGEACIGDFVGDADGDGTCDALDSCPSDPVDLCTEMASLVAVHDTGNTEAYAACPGGTELITGWFYQMSNDYDVDDGSCSHRDQIGTCAPGGAGCGTPGACNTDGNDEAFAYALCSSDPGRWDEFTWVGVRGNDGPTTATCPGGTNIKLGWSVQFSDEHSGEDCFKANQQACPEGAASCSTVECNTAGDDEQIVLVGCHDSSDPSFDGLVNDQLTGNAAAYTVSCPVGYEIVHGWAIQHVEESPIEPCLKAQNFACPLGASDCSSADCNTVPGDDESMLYINCWPSAAF